ncbi:QRFP-like peptide receptor [Montipora foliosa]|uniref:QRFP-like peptide receptor n=1 Tax=Montipora foliosa TaxID=591990 RepID=UPI0035F10E07
MISANFTNGSSNPQNGGKCNLYDYFNHPSSITAFKMFFMSLILLISLVGNTLIILVVYKRKELRKTVNFLIVNMAVSDLIFPTIAIPLSLTSEATKSLQWKVNGTAGLVLCKLQFFLMNVSLGASVQSLLWIAIDRFMAVVFPTKIKIISARFRTTAIASTWTVAMVGSLKDFFTVKLEEYNGTTFCLEDTDNNYSLYRVWSFVLIGGFIFAPFIVMTVLYGAIGVTLCRRRKLTVLGKVYQKNTSNQQAIKMSLCIVVVFCIFSASFATLSILRASGEWKYLESNPRFCWLYGVSGFMVYIALFLSSITNPVICLTFVKSYLRGVKEILICRKTVRIKNILLKKGTNGRIATLRISAIET